MSDGYANHAANERTFLAWLRSGLAVTSFGLLLARLNLLVAGSAASAQAQSGSSVHVLDPFYRYDALALAGLGILMILLGAIRFVRTTFEINHPTSKAVSTWRLELSVAAAVSLLVATYCVLSLI